MSEVLFVLGGGVGNIVQATPAIQLVAGSGHIIDLRLHCNSSKDVEEIFKLSCVRHVYSQRNPIGAYDFQLNGPFTPGHRCLAKKFFRTRMNYAQHLPEAEVYYDLAKQISVTGKLPDSKINFGPKGPLPKSQNTVALYPGSKHNWAMKRWDKFDELAKKFDDVVVIGKPDDIHSHGNPAWITRPWDWPAHVEFFSGLLREAAYLISRCKMFIGNDGGLSHVAAATGTPTFVIFGPSSDTKNRPHAQNAHVIAIDLPCRPCQFTAGPDGKQIFGGDKADCPYHMRCMRELSVDYVVKCISTLTVLL